MSFFTTKSFQTFLLLSTINPNGICMKIKYRETKGPDLLFELHLKMCKNTQFVEIKCLKFQNKMCECCLFLFL